MGWGAHAAAPFAAMAVFFKLLPGMVLGGAVSALAARLIYGRPLLEILIAALSLPVVACIQLSLLAFVGVDMSMPMGLLVWTALLLTFHGVAAPVVIAIRARLWQMLVLSGIALLTLAAAQVSWQ